MDILVIGPGSLVGSRFIELLPNDWQIFGAGGSLNTANSKLADLLKLDITNYENVSQVISQYSGKYLINFAGATLVDEIEKQRPKNPQDPGELSNNVAYQVNLVGTKNIITACQKANKFPIFISTGFVF